MTPQIPKYRRIVGNQRTKLQAKLTAQYQQGATIRALAAATGRSYGFIHRLLSESDVPLRGRGGGKPGHKRRATNGQ